MLLREAALFEALAVPDMLTARKWIMRTVSLSRKGVVQRLRSVGIPERMGKGSTAPQLLSDVI